ncbi:CapA family protein [Oribacterium sp. WCC10]|uniref:CapA family protein n=1 Tax=Oribacterium sp. WCC10 TaxID=1855343 RepID=UPI0008DFF944|nr:CapA family protein [Oribacterium sp. WCC10]SFG21549.1 poly-gamma-glutamate synthesis protein (capsule biosynthesis protein) [Oribacterium sp. WCC10]
MKDNIHSKAVNLIFTGDIGFDKYMQDRWKDPELLSPAVQKFFDSGDHVIANVEGPLIEANDNGSHGVFFHSMNPEAVNLLDKIHSDIWNISNNHIMDAGLDGLVNTRCLAGEHKAMTIGAGVNDIEASSPVILPESGGIGMFGVAYMSECIPATSTEPGVFRWDAMNKIKERILEIKSKCRWCIVVAHGGEEFAAMPNPYTRNRYIEYLNMGADLVVAHHPHVVENYETFPNGKAIFYSLGNFIFDTDYQRVHPYTDRGVLLKLSFTESEMSFEALGTRIVRGREVITDDELPPVFSDIPSEDYELLAPLSANAFIEEERKKMIYLEPERFRNASEDVWNSYFFSEEPDGYFKDAHMDLSLIVPLSRKAALREWEKSKLEKIKEYILTMASI